MNDRQVSTRVTHRTSTPSDLDMDLTTIGSSELNLKWTKSLGVTSYEVILSLADVGATISSKKLDQTVEQYSFDSLLPYTAYDVTLKAFYSHGIFTTASDQARTFSISPTLSADSIGVTTGVISWSRVPGSESFTLNLYENNVLMQSHQLDSAEIEHFTLDQLNPYTPYEAELLAHLTEDNHMIGYVNFKTDPESPKIEIISVTESSVDFKWTSVPDVNSYMVMLASNGVKPIEMELGPSTSTLTIDNLGMGSIREPSVLMHCALIDI